MTPDIAKEEFWTNINGMPESYNGNALDTSKAIYTKDGYWLIPYCDGSTVDVYKYNHNTGEIDICTNMSIITTQDIDSYGVLYDVITDKILIYHSYQEDHDYIFEIESSSFETHGMDTETNTFSILDLNDIIDRDNVSSISGRAIAFYHGAFYYEGLIAHNKQAGDYGDCYDYWHIIANSGHSLSSNSTESTPDGMGSGSEYANCSFRTDAFNIGDLLYLARHSYSYENGSGQGFCGVSIYLVSILDGADPVLDTTLSYITGISGSYFSATHMIRTDTCPDPSGTYFYTILDNCDGTISVYKLYENEDDDIRYSYVTQYDVTGDSNIGIVFCYNNSVCIYQEDYSYDSDTFPAVLINPDGDNIFTDISSNDILLNMNFDRNSAYRSNIIFSSYLNGSDKYYFFDGNDQTERLPIITVDEEAYCFMKIKE